MTSSFRQVATDLKSYRLVGIAALGVIATACGGKVIFDASSTAAGGANTTTTGAVFQTVGTTHASNTVGTSVVATNVVTVVNSTAVVGTSVVSSGDVAPSCDNGQMGDPNAPICNTCTQCAASTLCVSQVNDYNQSPDAQAFIGCAQACMPQTDQCIQTCEAQHPQGSQLYFALLSCLFCNACPINCSDPQFCAMPGG